MTETENLTIEILRQIRSELKVGLGGLREDVQRTNERLDQTVLRLDQTVLRLDQTVLRLDQTVLRLDNVKELQDLLVHEHRKTNQRLDFFAEELIRMRTRDHERLTSLETAVAELQRKVG